MNYTSGLPNVFTTRKNLEIVADGIQSGAIKVAFLPMPKRPNTMLNDASNAAITFILCNGERPSSDMLKPAVGVPIADGQLWTAFHNCPVAIAAPSRSKPAQETARRCSCVDIILAPRPRLKLERMPMRPSLLGSESFSPV